MRTRLVSLAVSLLTFMGMMVLGPVGTAEAVGLRANNYGSAQVQFACSFSSSRHFTVNITYDWEETTSGTYPIDYTNVDVTYSATFNGDRFAMKNLDSGVYFWVVGGSASTKNDVPMDLHGPGEDIHDPNGPAYIRYAVYDTVSGGMSACDGDVFLHL